MCHACYLDEEYILLSCLLACLPGILSPEGGHDHDKHTYDEHSIEMGRKGKGRWDGRVHGIRHDTDAGKDRREETAVLNILERKEDLCLMINAYLKPR